MGKVRPWRALWDSTNKEQDVHETSVVMLSSAHGADCVWQVPAETKLTCELKGQTNMPSQYLLQTSISCA